MANVDKMYTYLRGFLVGANMAESLKALGFARQQHSLQTRKDGTPYIIHPLSMACYAVAMGLKEDNIIATILLHDVPEDCGIPVEYIPVNKTIQNAVKHMTIQCFKTDSDKIEAKCRYFNELLESREALICKALDRYNNLSDAPFALSVDAIGKNVAETELLLMPVLKQAKTLYPDLADALFILRTNLQVLLDILKNSYEADYLKWKSRYERGTM
jgi:GTP pyrophosphokinase